MKRIAAFRETSRGTLLSVLTVHFFSAVKRIIVINRIQNKSFCLHNICMCTVYILYINTHTHTVYIWKIFTCIYIYIFIFLYFILYINICIYKQHFFS